jgi:hypothetical protein
VQVNAPSRPEPQRETDQAKEQRGNPSVIPVQQTIRSSEQTRPRNPAVPSDEGAFVTFVGGAGI